MSNPCSSGPQEIRVNIRARPRIHIGLHEPSRIITSICPSININSRIPIYSGGYYVMPSEDEQRLSTAGQQLEQDVIINPIPSNYGRIVWDGVTLRVF